MLLSPRREPAFYRTMIALAAPMVLQNIITTSLGFIDTFMVGLLGNAEMAAVTAANVPIFIIQVVIFGFQSGMAVLVSQYWGRGDTDNINRCMGVALYAVIGFSTLLALITFFFPAQVLSLITPNETLVALGTRYIQIVGFSYIFNGISSIYAGLHRSTEFPLFGTALFAVSMVSNTILNYILIFGHFGSIGGISISVKKSTLEVMREVGLALFLMGAGTQAGKGFVEVLKAQGVILFLLGALMTIVPMIIGYILARYVFKIDILTSLGAICGGMTSTPALGTLITMTKAEAVAISYAATYPVALIFVVLACQFLPLIVG